ncbi:MAG: manganese efflux pump [Mycobacterium sp.]
MWLPPEIYLGLDSLVVSAAVAPLVPIRSSRLLFATLFGGFDALATVLGASLGWQLPEGLPHYLLVGLVFLYGGYVCLVAYWGRHAIARWPIWLMPLFCSLDNLSYGITAHHASGTIAAHAAILGITSAGMAGLGMIAARAFSPARQPRRAGPLLLIAAGVLAVS